MYIVQQGAFGNKPKIAKYHWLEMMYYTIKLDLIKSAFISRLIKASFILSFVFDFLLFVLLRFEICYSHCDPSVLAKKSIFRVGWTHLERYSLLSFTIIVLFNDCGLLPIAPCKQAKLLLLFFIYSQLSLFTVFLWLHMYNYIRHFFILLV